MPRTVEIKWTKMPSSSRIPSLIEYIRSNYIFTVAGLLNLLQLLVGAACLGIVCYTIEQRYIRDSLYYNPKTEVYFLLATSACMTGNFCLLTACVFSSSTASMISKTVYQVIHHGVAITLCFSAGVTLLVKVSYRGEAFIFEYDNYLAASVTVIINSVLYLLSMVLALHKYCGN